MKLLHAKVYCVLSFPFIKTKKVDSIFIFCLYKYSQRCNEM